MKSIIEKIYLHRDKESNWEIEDKLKELGFPHAEKIVYLGYEIGLTVEIFEDGNVKLLKINNVDISEKNISI